jgi:hypothetical protein
VRGSPLTKAERETIDVIAKNFSDQLLQGESVASFAEDLVSHVEHDVRVLQEKLEDEQRKRLLLEEAKRELLDILEKKVDDEGGEGGILSELFEAKKQAEEKLDDSKKKLKNEQKARSDMEDQYRKLQLRLEKTKRDLDTETKSGLSMRKKLEDELRDWKSQLEHELEKSMKRLEEEDQARKELENVNVNLQHEIAESKRQIKLLQTEFKAKTEVEQEEKRTLLEANRRYYSQ